MAGSVIGPVVAPAAALVTAPTKMSVVVPESTVLMLSLSAAPVFATAYVHVGEVTGRLAGEMENCEIGVEDGVSPSRYQIGF